MKTSGAGFKEPAKRIAVAGSSSATDPYSTLDPYASGVTK